MEYLVHFGMDKAGSTAIQSSFNQFDDGRTRHAAFGPLNHGIVFDTLFGEDPMSAPGHKNNGRTKTEVVELQKRWDKQLTDELRLDRSRLIFSGEGIAKLPSTAILRMADRFNAHGGTMRLVAYVRHPAEYASSALQQRVKSGATTLYPARTYYCERIERFQAVFGDESVEVVAFDRASFPSGSVVSDFAARIDVPPNAIDDTDTNSSLSNDAVLMLLMFNRSLGDVPSSRLATLARREMIRVLQDAVPGPGFRLPLSAIEPVLNEDDVALFDEMVDRPYEPAVGPSDFDESFISAESVERLSEAVSNHGLNVQPSDGPVQLTRMLYESLLSKQA